MNDEIYKKYLCYQTVMAWARNLLNQSLITRKEYAKIDTMTARKYGISSCSIFR